MFLLFVLQKLRPLTLGYKLKLNLMLRAFAFGKIWRQRQGPLILVYLIAFVYLKMFRMTDTTYELQKGTPLRMLGEYIFPYSDGTCGSKYKLEVGDFVRSLGLAIDNEFYQFSG